MNKYNLEVGQVFKNYKKELCEWLGVTPTKGKGMQYHIREFERYCKYHKDGQKFIVDEVYETPLDKIDGRINNEGANNNKYTELDDIIIEALLNQREKYIRGSFTRIFCDFIPIFTEEYMYFHKANIKDLRYKKFNFASDGLVKIYHSTVRNKVNSSFKSALNRLQKQEIIKWEIIYIVLMGKKKITVRSDMKLYQKIKDAQKEICEEMDMKYYRIFESDKNKEIFNKKLEEKLHIQNYYVNYEIHLLQENIEYPKTDIFQLKKKYISSIHKYIVNKDIKNEFDETFYPYKLDVNTKAIILMDSYFWQGKEVIETENIEFQKMYNDKLFGNEDVWQQEEFPTEEITLANDEIFIPDYEEELPF